jgi:hypothetical protein
LIVVGTCVNFVKIVEKERARRSCARIGGRYELTLATS